MLSRKPLRFLIIEDEALLAMDLAAIIEQCGHEVAGEAASLAEVAALSTELPADCALVDVQLLHGGSGIDAACLLRQFWPEIEMLFVTANPGQVPSTIEGAIGILPKPFTRPGLAAAIDYLAVRRGAGGGAWAVPPGILPLRVRAPS